MARKVDPMDPKADKTWDAKKYNDIIEDIQEAAGNHRFGLK